ncbi:MAG: hypothetical protein ABI193_22120 [Minicystis sp.]
MTLQSQRSPRGAARRTALLDESKLPRAMVKIVEVNGSVRRPRWDRIFVTTLGSVRVASARILAAHLSPRTTGPMEQRSDTPLHTGAALPVIQVPAQSTEMPSASERNGPKTSRRRSAPGAKPRT